MSTSAFKPESKIDRAIIPLHVRWSIRSDMPRLLSLEHRCFRDPWTEQDWRSYLGQPNVIAMVGEYDGHIVAYMVYELQRKRLHLANLAVSPEYRRLGFGTQMLVRLQNKVNNDRRQGIECYVSEENLGTHLFFKASGWKATRVVPDNDGGPDKYVFEYTARRDV